LLHVEYHALTQAASRSKRCMACLHSPALMTLQAKAALMATDMYADQHRVSEQLAYQAWLDSGETPIEVPPTTPSPPPPTPTQAAALH